MKKNIKSNAASFGVSAILLLGAALAAHAQNPVVFSVDMSVKTAEGTFNPAVNGVEARGGFNGWAGGFTLTNRLDNTNIFQGTFDLPDSSLGTTIEYKFVITPGDGYEARPNRNFVLQSGGQTLPTVYYDDDSVINTNIAAAVYFQVNMNVQLLNGNFNPGTNDQVWARGGAPGLGWGAPPEGLQLFEDTARSGIYTNTFATPSFQVGANFEYKYTIWRPGTLSTKWEDAIANRVVVFTGAEPTNSGGYHLATVGPSYFDDVVPTAVLTADTLVTFRVNMAGAVGTDAHAFDTNVGDGVWFNAGFIPWWGWKTYPPEYKMADDGTLGDAVAGDSIFTWQRLFPAGSALRVEYKYGINSIDNEAASGSNHVRYINATGTYVMPLDTFGTMTQESGPATNALGNVTISLAGGGNVNLAWTGGAGIYMQGASSLTSPSWQIMSNTAGLSTITVPATNSARYFRLIKP